MEFIEQALINRTFYYKYFNKFGTAGINGMLVCSTPEGFTTRLDYFYNQIFEMKLSMKQTATFSYEFWKVEILVA